MTYSYNAKAHYAPYGKHQELITGEDLTQLEIVVRDENKKLRRGSFTKTWRTLSTRPLRLKTTLDDIRANSNTRVPG